MYLQFLSFLRTDTTQVIEIPLHSREGPTYFTLSMVNIMAADDLAMQGARASTAMKLT